MAFISYTIENDKQFQKALSEAFEKTQDLTIPLRAISRDFYKSQKAIFQLKSPGKYPDYTGPKISETWKTPGRPDKRTRDGSLTAYQNYKKQKVGFIYPMLKFTGDLEKSTTSPTGPDSILNITKSSLEIGTGLPYAAFHQYGTKNMPMRKFLFIGPEAPEAVGPQRGRLDRWLKIIEDHVTKSTKGISDV
jgi:phage gpG-like protein